MLGVLRARDDLSVALVMVSKLRYFRLKDWVSVDQAIFESLAPNPAKVVALVSSLVGYRPHV